MPVHAEHVRIHYRRPPDREEIFVQEVLHRSERAIITYLASTPLSQPLRVRDTTVLANGSPVIWLTYPGALHDIGCFHLPDGTFTGYYANILTPVRFLSPTEWETTDLFLDVWLGADGELGILDEDELEQAVRAGWLGAATATLARAEADRLVHEARAGEWPPAEARAWTLDRVAKQLRRRM